MQHRSGVRAGATNTQGRTQREADRVREGVPSRVERASGYLLVKTLSVRGTNESNNGLVRQQLPNSTCMKRP